MQVFSSEILNCDVLDLALGRVNERNEQTIK